MSIHPEVAAGWGKRRKLEEEVARLKATIQSLKNQLKQAKEQHNGTSKSDTRV